MASAKSATVNETATPELTAQDEQISTTEPNPNDVLAVSVPGTKIIDEIQLAHLSSTVSGTAQESTYQPAPSHDGDAEAGEPPKGKFRIAAILVALSVRTPNQAAYLVKH
jgi:hypothetical protein